MPACTHQRTNIGLQGRPCSDHPSEIHTSRTVQIGYGRRSLWTRRNFTFFEGGSILKILMLTAHRCSGTSIARLSKVPNPISEKDEMMRRKSAILGVVAATALSGFSSDAVAAACTVAPLTTYLPTGSNAGCTVLDNTFTFPGYAYAPTAGCPLADAIIVTAHPDPNN